MNSEWLGQTPVLPRLSYLQPSARTRPNLRRRRKLTTKKWFLAGGHTFLLAALLLLPSWLDSLFGDVAADATENQKLPRVSLRLLNGRLLCQIRSAHRQKAVECHMCSCMSQALKSTCNLFLEVITRVDMTTRYTITVEEMIDSRLLDILFAFLPFVCLIKVCSRTTFSLFALAIYVYTILSASYFVPTVASNVYCLPFQAIIPIKLYQPEQLLTPTKIFNTSKPL